MYESQQRHRDVFTLVNIGVAWIFETCDLINHGTSKGRYTRSASASSHETIPGTIPGNAYALLHEVGEHRYLADSTSDAASRAEQ